MLMENKLRALVSELTPEMVWEQVPEDHPYFSKLAEMYKKDRDDFDRCHFKIRLEYIFNSFVQIDSVWYAEYVAYNPLCHTDNPSNWWWTERRDDPDFQELLKVASGKPLKILKELGLVIAQVVVPNPVEWRII